MRQIYEAYLALEEQPSLPMTEKNNMSAKIGDKMMLVSSLNRCRVVSPLAMYERLYFGLPVISSSLTFFSMHVP